MLTSLVFVLLIGSLASAIVEREHTVLYERTGAPYNSKWSLLEPASPDEFVTFTIALKQSNLELLEQMLMDDSDPDSPKYGKHFTRKQITDIVSAPLPVQESVLQWINEVAVAYELENSIISIWNSGDSITVKATVEFIQKLFFTDMWLFYNEKNNVAIIKHLGTLSVPTDLVEHIDLITGITELPPIEIPFLGSLLPKQNYPTDNLCNVPFTFKSLYGIPQNINVTNQFANQSIYSEDSGGPEGFGIGSVAAWQHANGLSPNPINCILGNGANDYFPNNTDTEAQLDTQMMTGMAAGAKTCFYIMEYGYAWMFEFSQVIFNTSDAPLVVSMSYGWWEAEQCNNETTGIDFLSNCSALHIPNSQAYVRRTNIEFMKLGLVGHTLLAASGDDGTEGTHGTSDNCATMNPIFPAASPYVLTVGATSIEPMTSTSAVGDDAPLICTDSFYQCNCTTSTNEQACLSNNTGGFDTGGGFSTYSVRPSYQAAAVHGYINSGVTLPSPDYWNPANRGFPDVSAVGENVCILDPGTPCEFVGGTSASTPIWGAIITLLNSDRLTAGKSPLGFVNPLIYKMYGLNKNLFFNNKMDIGNNGAECGPQMGFNAVHGWDPLTGCGSPKFANIRKYVATLP